MKSTEAGKTIFRVAKSLPADTRVPYAFEKRIMAALKEAPSDLWALWGQLLWRAAVPCIAITIISSAWLATHHSSQTATSDDYNLESTVLAFEPDFETW
ncbi:MAG: hypothetical protein SFY81_09945 [Verrucomicrobiota bacterium]|nr:hypothetical protein [Verrucomicrobiota bacterium]